MKVIFVGGALDGVDDTPMALAPEFIQTVIEADGMWTEDVYWMQKYTYDPNVEDLVAEYVWIGTYKMGGRRPRR